MTVEVVKHTVPEPPPTAQAVIKPTLSYMICAAPRTGSTLLAQALGHTGRAGRPNEFFDIYEQNDQFWRQSLSIGSDAEYFDKVVGSTTTPNGVFGLKLLWHQWPALLAKLRAAPDLASLVATASPHDLLQAKLGTVPRYLWIRREDKLAQAISYYRASRSGLWRSTDKQRPGMKADSAIDFDFDLVIQYLRTVNDFDLRWEEYFRKNKLKVLMITYENFITAYEATVMSAMEFLGLPRDGVTLPPPRLQRQADARSLDWRRRFLEIGRQRGVVSISQRKTVPASPTEGNGAAPETRLLADTAASTRDHRRREDQTTLSSTSNEPGLLLHAYQLTPNPAPIVKATQERDWMEATPIRFAYRCLPMVIANQNGWLLLNRHKISVIWSGGPDPAALKIQFLGGEEPRDAVSLFGSGVLTFTIGYLFRTAPGYNLHVRGPTNAPKDGIVALEGIVETDWTEATFTMNWKVTRPNHPLVFEEGEPIAMISPLKRGETERFRPELHLITEQPQLAALHYEWSRSRSKHNEDLKIPDSKARKDGWQRHYVRGVSIRKEPAHEHQTKLLLTEFSDRRGSKPDQTK